MKPVLVALACFILAAAAQAAPAFQPISGTGFEGVLVPQERAAEFWHLQGQNPAPASYWTPSRAEVEAFEAALPEFLQNAAAMHAPVLTASLSDFRRQYVGVVKDGHRVLYVNFVCASAVREHHQNWQDQAVQVEDGGSCYFQAEYDTQTGKFLHLQVNGEA